MKAKKINTKNHHFLFIYVYYICMLGILYVSQFVCSMYIFFTELCSVKLVGSLKSAITGIFTHGNLQTLQGLFISEVWLLNIYQHTAMHTPTLTPSPSIDFFHILFNTGITTFMSQYNTARKTFSCIKVL